jgi:hypothetical protein
MGEILQHSPALAARDFVSAVHDPIEGCVRAINVEAGDARANVSNGAPKVSLLFDLTRRRRRR